MKPIHALTDAEFDRAQRDWIMTTRQSPRYETDLERADHIERLRKQWLRERRLDLIVPIVALVALALFAVLLWALFLR